MTPTIIDALDMWSAWHGDEPPAGSTGDHFLDLRISDAFRALIYLGDREKQLDWIAREVARLKHRFGEDPRYQIELVRWFLDLTEDEKGLQAA